MTGPTAATTTATVAVFFRENLYTGEPLFVPNPAEGAAEDDGTVLVVALDADAGETVLLALDAQTMTQVARALWAVTTCWVLSRR